MQQLPIRPIFSFRDFIDGLAKKFATKKMKLPNVLDSNLPLVCDAHGRVESTWKQQQLNLFSLAGLTFGNAKKSLNRLNPHKTVFQTQMNREHIFKLMILRSKVDARLEVASFSS